MRKTFTTGLIIFLALPLLVLGQTKMMSFKTGSALNESAQFGMDLGTFQPYLGLKYVAFKANMELDLDGSETGLELSSADVDVSAGLIIPHIGLRMLLSDNDTRPYIFGEFFKSFVSEKFEVDGESMVEEDVEDFVKNILGFWGIKAGIGAEYKINENFGVVGEYGLSMYFMGGELEADASEFSEELTEEIKTDISASIRNTYVTVGLNFYF